MLSRVEKRRVASTWGHHSPTEHLRFFAFGPVRDYMLQCVSGDKDACATEAWLEEWAIAHVLHDTPVAECLSLCCGLGDRDRSLARLGAFKHCVGMDISENAIAEARSRAKAEGLSIDYVVADLDAAQLGTDTYDFVFAGGALHHLSNLERVVGQIHACLKPGGVFLSDEYVGPAFNDLSDRHRELVNAAIHLLPNRLRHACEDTFVPREWRYPHWRRGLYELVRLARLKPVSFAVDNHSIPLAWPSYKRKVVGFAIRMSRALAARALRRRSFRFGQVWDTAPKAIRGSDPSEGVRSDEIIPVVKAHFADARIHYLNGSILHYALDQKFFANYEPDRDHRLLQLLMELERTSIEREEIPPILAVIAARKQPSTSIGGKA